MANHAGHTQKHPMPPCSPGCTLLRAALRPACKAPSGRQSTACLDCRERLPKPSALPTMLCHMPHALMVSLRYCGRYQVPKLLTRHQQVPNCLFFCTRCSFKTKLHVNPQVPAYFLQPLACWRGPRPFCTWLLGVSEMTRGICAVVQLGRCVDLKLPGGTHVELEGCLGTLPHPI